MSIRRIVFCFLTIIVLLPFYSPAQDKGFGIGAIIGEPTGISIKNWLTSSTAIDAALAWSFVRETSFHIHADYLFHSHDAIKTEEPVILYFGIGGRIKTGKNEQALFGARGVIGIAYFFEKAPVDLFLEAAPIIDLTPATAFRFNAGFGIRYFFK
ncbi:MAG TPA: hypothetical protein VFF29_05130 [Bacteroidota bacterium]|nr:hypothetical protein [Bacteroidota bacterium]